jgi:membrane-bound lytic murein transglycosylase D
MVLIRSLGGSFQLLLLSSLLISGCATVNSNTKPAVIAGAQSDILSPPVQVTEAEKVQIGAAAPAPPGTDLSATGVDLSAIPIEVNKSVLQSIDYFQGQGRPHMERYLSRSTRYMPIMKQVLRENGLPEDLVYIALIESGFSSTAKSTASAVGYWQFIKGTGKRYGLQIDSYVDERRDFVKSTRAAAEYFKGLYNLFGAWYLAIASYNVGENRVKGLVMKYHTRDFWQLARENKLPQETVNYVPKFIAAALIAKNPEKYGFADVEYMPPLTFAEVELKHSVDIKKMASAMGLEYDDLRDLNPSYKSGLAFEKNGKLKIRVPVGTEGQAVAAAAQASSFNKRVVATDEDYTYYRVRRGESLASIAKKFRTSARELQKLNSLSGGAKLVAGRRIRVPAEVISNPGGRPRMSSTIQAGAQAPPSRLPAASRKLKKKSASKAIVPTVHIVRPGDTLADIARQYNVRMSQIISTNSLQRKTQVNIGSRLLIPNSQVE